MNVESMCLRILAILLLAGVPVFAEDIRYPDDMRIIDLTREPYVADPTGKRDSTQAIQKALDNYHGGDNWTLYLPNGTYMIRDTLDWGNGARLGPILQGQSRDGVTIKLEDEANGFRNPEFPKALIRIANKGSADAFCMSVRNMTIDTGKGNPAAIGIQYMSNNQGAVRDVRIHSGDGQGVIGLDMAFTDMIGPCLIKNVEIHGFDVGIATGWTVASMTLEHIRLLGQKKTGLRNTGQCISVRGLVSKNRVPAVTNTKSTSFMILIDATLNGMDGAVKYAAIENDAHCLLRNIKTPGYGVPLDSSMGEYKHNHPDFIEEFVSAPPVSLFPGIKRSLSLPIRETPDVPWEAPETWANVIDFGADPSDKNDDTEAIQKAIDSGARTVYFPHPLPAGKEKTDRPRGRYQINGTIILRGNVRRLIGGGGYWTMLTIGGESRGAVFAIGDEGPPAVIIEDFNVVNGVAAPFIRHSADTRTVIMRHVNSIMFHTLYYGEDGAGPAFFEDVAAQYPMNADQKFADTSQFRFGEGQSVWARQLNPENNGIKIINDGADVWILGLKTEVKSTVLENHPGARTEILGGLNYPSLPGEGTQEAFRILGGQVSISIGEAGFHRRFDEVVKETRNGETRVLKRGEPLGRSGGTLLPLYSSTSPIDGKAPLPPNIQKLQANPMDARTIRLDWNSEGDINTLGEYVVYRDGKEIARTRLEDIYDRNLNDNTSYAYAVTVLDRDGTERSRRETRVTTPRDEQAPTLMSAAYQTFPRRIELVFDEPVSPPDTNPETCVETTPVVPVLAVHQGESPSCLNILLGPGSVIPDRIRVRNVVDRAMQPNRMSTQETHLTVPLQPRIVLQDTFDALDTLPASIVDDSAWNKGAKAMLSIHPQAGGLLIGVDRFAQVILGYAPVKAGRSFRVRAVFKEKPEFPVTLMVRQKDKPYAVHGSVSGEDDVIEFVFEPSKSDPSARLYFIAKGTGHVNMESVTILALPTEDELSSPPDETPPHIDKAIAHDLPARVIVTFSEPVVEDLASDPANIVFTPSTRLDRIEWDATGTQAVVFLKDTAVPPSSVLVKELQDLAPRPNAAKDVSASIWKAPSPRILIQQNFDGLDDVTLHQAISDNSAWNKGAKASLSLQKASSGGQELAIGVERYAQIVLGRLPVTKGKEYRVFFILSSTKKNHPVKLLVRQWGKPYTTWGQSAFTLTPVSTRNGFTFLADDDDSTATLYLESQGDAVVRLDDLLVTEGADTGETYPIHSMQAGASRAFVYLPDMTNGYYRGTRFDHAGMVGQLEYAGHTYFGELIRPHDPERHDGVAGPAEEFGMKLHPPLGYEEAQPGDGFLKIGVGVLEKKTDKPYAFFGRYKWVKPGTWDIQREPKALVFTQELSHGPYAYRYVKRVVLREEAPHLRLEHRLENTGTRLLISDYYNHNMLALDKSDVNQDYRLVMPAGLATQERRNTKEMGVEFEDGILLFGKLLPKGDSFTIGYSLPPQTEMPIWAVSMKGSHQRLEQHLDWQPVHFEVYGMRDALCPEPFLEIRLAPGEATSWMTGYACSQMNTEKQ